MNQQVIFINGGEPKENFESYHEMLRGQEYNPYQERFLNWNKTLWEKLWEDYEYLKTPLHDRNYADYEAWKIMFEKMIPYFHDEILIWATSLWGAFILKYLWENDWILNSKTGKKIKIKKLFLVAVAIEDTKDEVLGSFSFDIEQVYTRVSRWSQEIFIYHSLDDDIVPYEQSLKLNSYFPEAVFREFHDRGHFYLESEFPELLEDIKS